MASKFKMPPHPIYRFGWGEHMSMYTDIAKRHNASLEDVFEMMRSTLSIEEFKRNTGEQHIPSDTVSYSEVLMRLHIAHSGHVLMKIDEKHWEESISQKTLENLDMESINLPYPAFSIDLSTASWSGMWDVAHVSQWRGNLVIRLETTDERWWVYPFTKKTVKENIDFFEEEIQGREYQERETLIKDDGTPFTEEDFVQMAEDMKGEISSIAFKLISIIMYASLFKHEKNRFDVRSVKARRTQGIPSYRISEVRLIQPEYSLHGVTRGSDRKGGDKERQSHIVRGHWRSQPYGKREEGKTRPKWIAPFWKGSQKDNLTKVVKL